MKEAGAFITVNTDDPSVIGTTIKEEYKALIQNFKLTKEDIKQLLMNAAVASFADEKTKAKMLRKIETEIE